MRKIFLLLSALLVLLGSSSVYAAPSHEKKTGLYPDGYYDASTGETVMAVYRMNAKGEPYQVPLDQWVKEKEAEKSFWESEMKKEAAFKTSQASPSSTDTKTGTGTVSPNSGSVYYTYDRYDEGTNTFVSGYRQKMSNNVNCTTSGQDCPITAQWSMTTSSEFSANVGSATEKNAISGGVSYTYNSSATTSMSYTLYVPKGTTGYLAFTPFLRYSSGYIRHYEYAYGVNRLISSEWSWTKYPMKLYNGTADGEWKIMRV